ncbi:MAG: DUF4255 domain-containing protein [Ilumatobacteraceae bacterium]|nr:DUF4255 domain-containing protein [Ilumatobacteraceae bacterium]
MASYRGIGSAAQAVIEVLRDSWEPAKFNGSPFGAQLCRSLDLQTPPIEFGYSVYVPSVVVGGARRTMPPTIEGHRRSLPLEVTLILTAWAASAELELDLMGWAMLVLEENAVLGSARLNAAVPGVYQPAEIVELVPVQMSPDEQFRLWDVLPYDLQLSVTYVIRSIRLQSDRVVTDAGPVLEREYQVGILEDV